jgi:hypothetical protein
MALTAVEKELLLIQKFKKNQINLLENGVRLVGVAGNYRYLRKESQLGVHQFALSEGTAPPG